MSKESQHTEFKPNFNEDVIETLAAFANTNGGKVLVGVNDSGQPVKNFTIGKESIQNWINEIKTKTNPQLIPDAEPVEYKGKEVVEFSVQEYPIKPVVGRVLCFRLPEQTGCTNFQGNKMDRTLRDRNPANQGLFERTWIAPTCFRELSTWFSCNNPCLERYCHGKGR